MTCLASLSAVAPGAAPHARRGVDRALVLFFVFAYLLPWSVWGSRIAQEHGWIGWHLPGGVALWTLVPVTLTAVSLTSGRAGLVDLLPGLAEPAFRPLPARLAGRRPGRWDRRCQPKPSARQPAAGWTATGRATYGR